MKDLRVFVATSLATILICFVVVFLWLGFTWLSFFLFDSKQDISSDKLLLIPHNDRTLTEYIGMEYDDGTVGYVEPLLLHTDDQPAPMIYDGNGDIGTGFMLGNEQASIVIEGVVFATVDLVDRCGTWEMVVTKHNDSGVIVIKEEAEQ